jgi:thiol-disulfide isomerase/thioredoxin
MSKNFINLFVSVFIILSFNAFGQTLKQGNWQGNIHFAQQTIPFTFEVSNDSGNIVITLINWEERLPIGNVRISGEDIVIPMHVFDAIITARYTADKMEGYWIKLDSIPFTAEYNTPRFKKVKSKRYVEIGEKMNMTFSPPRGLAYPGVGIFHQEGSKVVGTVLTEVGDFRYFEGVINKETIQMSSFDGVHAFMITGEYKDGSWQGLFHFDNNYTENWTGYNDPLAEIRDPFGMVELEKETQRPYFDIIAPASGRDVVDPSKYEGKVVIIQLFGTWCPNSYDETNFLVDWYKVHHERGVEVLGVSYEVKYTKEYGLKRIEEYKRDMGIPYEVFLGGRVSKEQAAMAFPFIKKIEAFPTLVILDKKGYARYVNSYFLGPATGEYYLKFKDRLNTIVEELLAE